MNLQRTNLFIVDSNKIMVEKLERYLFKRFGTSLNISSFYTGESCLEKIDQHTSFVILAYFFDGQNGNEILKTIKSINPKTEVIMLTSNEDAATAIESFRAGASDYLIKSDTSWKKILPHVYRVITEPMLRLGREFGLSKFTVIFLATFILMGAVVFFALKIHL